jgi:hypothetical protein
LDHNQKLGRKLYFTFFPLFSLMPRRARHKCKRSKKIKSVDLFWVRSSSFLIDSHSIRTLSFTFWDFCFFGDPAASSKTTKPSSARKSKNPRPFVFSNVYFTLILVAYVRLMKLTHLEEAAKLNLCLIPNFLTRSHKRSLGQGKNKNKKALL